MISRRQIKTAVAVFLIMLVLINLPFLPGPNFLNGIGQFFLTVGQILGLIGIVGVPAGLIWFAIYETKKKNLFKPVIFIVIFLAPLVSNFVLSQVFRNFSRNIAIKNGNKLVKQIEEYSLRNGNYPDRVSDAGISMPSSGVIGITGYGYKKTDESFKVWFNQNLLFGFNIEIVTYNNRDEHEAVGTLPTLYKTSDKNWKYEIFD